MLIAHTVRQACLRLVCLSLFLFSFSAWPGEKIQISGDGDKLEIPRKADDPFSKPLEFLKSHNDVSSMPILPTPSSNPNIRKEKSTDANWIFETPETLDQEAMLKEIFKIREYDPEKRHQKSMTAAERFFGRENERDKDRKNQFRPGYQRKDDRMGQMKADGEALSSDRYKTSLSSSGEEEEGDSKQPIHELNLKNLLHPHRSQEYLSRFTLDVNGKFVQAMNVNRLLDPHLPASAGRNKQQETRLQEFEKLLGNRNALVNPLNDTLSLQQDTTRMEINPTIARRADDYLNEGPSSSPDSFGGVSAQAPLSRPRILEPFNPKVLGISSTAPTPLPNGPPVLMQPKPAVLEIPRRRF